MKDLYKILKVSSNATRDEIKDAYRKMALALHPDRFGGCETKAMEFRDVTEAYQTLRDQNKRYSYDMLHSKTNSKKPHIRRQPLRNYRKVYAPRPPPGFKTFDDKRHEDMHYGEGMMKEAIERLRRQQRGEFENDEGEYVSPLGRGFRFDDLQGGRVSGTGSYTRRKKGTDYEYEEAFVDMPSCHATRVLRTKEIVTIRLQERKKKRLQNQRRGISYRNGRPVQVEDSGCVVM